MRQSMKKEALFLPLMQIPTGHHHVANTLMEDFKKIKPTVNCQKIDILSYSFGKVESFISSIYLKWIEAFPQAYDGLYRQLAVKNLSNRKRQRLYEFLFTYYFKRLIREMNPDVLFCTHSLPSNLASVLKQKNKLSAITVNVYTDYFVNRVWGLNGIDYHFVPTVTVKEFLLQAGVDRNKIYVTGIPVHEAFHIGEERQHDNGKMTVLVTGGSLGVGRMEQIINNMENCRNMNFIVLCGKNESLYEKFKNKKGNHITPIRYIENKWEMNKLYNKVDAVITKAGGVTISECLMKKKPVFVCYALPGQERVNEEQLINLGLIIPLDLEAPIDDQVHSFFLNKNKFLKYKEKLQVYHEHLEKQVNVLKLIC